MDDDSAPLPLPPLAARSAEPGPPAGAWFLRLYAGAVRMLPALVLGAAAAGSWWLLRQTPESPEAPSVSGATDEPDYEMRGFSIRRTGAGDARIEGRHLRHFPQNDELRIDGAQVWLRPADGSELVASAPLASLSGPRKEVLLSGGARVERLERPGEVPMRLDTEQLLIDTERQLLSSERRVTLRQGKDLMTADQLRYDHAERVLELRGAVHGQLGAARAR